MTLGTTLPVIDYIEDGSGLTHAIPFQFDASSDIVCSRISNGVETILTGGGVNYSVSGGSGSGGTVTKTSAGTAGTIFRIKRKTSRAQPTDYTPGDAFPAETHEHALDRLSAVDQEQDVQIADVTQRSFMMPPGKMGLALSVLQISGVIGVDGSGNPAFFPLAGFAVGPAGPAGPSGNVLANGDYGDIVAAAGVLSIDAGVVSLAKMANLAANSIIGNNTGLSATPIALTAAQVTAMLVAMAGDSGLGGTKGVVAAPAAGDAAAGKFWSAGGLWAIPSVGALAHSLVFDVSGGASAGGSFNGSAAITIDYSSVGAAPAHPTIAALSTSFTSVDGDNNHHFVLSGAGQTLTLSNITAGISFTVRFTTAWILACAGGLSKNGAAPGGVTSGNVAANSLVTFLHEGSGVWVASGSGLT